MKKARTIEDVIEILDNEDSFETYRDVVNALAELGNTDDNLELRDNLSDEFLDLEINDEDSEMFEEEIGAIIDESNKIFTLLKQTLTPEELEDYLEERREQAQLLEDLSI